MNDDADLHRRSLMASTLALTALGAASSAFAASLLTTPRQTEGPFYPVTLPLDSDADLVQVKGRSGRAKGIVTHVSGRVLGADGRPIAGARVEIWQCDANGQYNHPGDRGGRGFDPNFQGFGRMTADAAGAYRFRTIKPVRYTGRAPHIHFAISGRGFERLTTQMYVAGDPDNRRDFLLNNIRDPKRRASVIVDLRPAPAIEPGALAGRFDIVVGAAG